MQKNLLLLILCCTFSSLFGQIKKGTMYFGESEISINQTFYRNSPLPNSIVGASVREIVVSPSFGLFVGDNMLIGGGFVLPIRSRFGAQEPSHRTSLNLSLFAKKYFLKKKIKPFIESHLFRAEENLGLEAGVGLAYFITDFTALEFNASIPVIYAPENEYFSTFFESQIGLSVKWFFLKEREKELKIIARDYLRKGTLSTFLTGSYGSYDNDLQGIARSSYFFTDCVYADFEVDFFTLVKRENDRKNFIFDLNMHFGSGGYIFFSEPLAIKISGGFTLHPYRHRSWLNSRIFFSGVDGQLGLAFFKKRHKIEALAGIELVQYENKGENLPVQSVTNLTIQINHEFFLSKNLSISSNLFFSPTSERFEYSYFENQRYAYLTGSNQNLLITQIGVKWYLNTKKLKKAQTTE